MNILVAALAIASAGALPTANEAWAIAAADARLLPADIRCVTRYVWIRDGKQSTARAVSFAENAVSRGTIIARPVPLGKEALLLVRFDLRRYSFKETDLQDHLRLWEEYQNDPAFSRFFTKDTIRFNHIEVIPEAKRWVTRECPEFLHTDGNKYRAKWVRESYTPTVADLDKIAVIRTPSEAIDPSLYRELCDLTGSEAPIVSHPYFIYRTLTTVQDEGVFKELYGGLYYELVGYKQDVKGKADLDGIFESIGVPNAEKTFEDLRSDRKVAMARSAITGRDRGVKIFPSLAGQDGGVVRISEDIQQSSIDIGSNPFMNLIKNQIDGQELIFTAPNRLQRFAALNGKGKLVREVPDKIAHDSTIPAPHPQRLQGALGCVVCHGPHDGLQPIRNDFLKIKRLVLGDQSRDDQYDANSRIASLYAGNPEKGELAILLSRVRDDYAAATLRATGPWTESEEAQTDVVRLVSAKLGEIRQAYIYDLVTPAIALAELGIEPGPDPVKKLQESILVNPGPVGLEDSRFALLLEGVGIGRFDWDLLRDFVAVRVKKEIKK